MKARTVMQAVAEDLESGKMSMRQAQENLCKCGLFPYLPDERQVSETVSEYKRIEQNYYGKDNN